MTKYAVVPGNLTSVASCNIIPYFRQHTVISVVKESSKYFID